jgi:hypothetical protein
MATRSNFTVELDLAATDLPQNIHFITLQIDGQSPNLFYSNYITKTEKQVLHSMTLTNYTQSSNITKKTYHPKTSFLVICPASICHGLIFETRI